jgi:hypothetical protein
MASVIQNRSGAWELRESARTAKGPRSRTLVTFHTLTPEIVERARARASRPLDPDELRGLAMRAGAPVAASPADRAAAELLRELDAGRRPRPALARLLADALGPAPRAPRLGSARPADAPVARRHRHATSPGAAVPADASAAQNDRPSDAARAAAPWIAATQRQRGDALRDLLLLGDRLPRPRPRERPRFPRIESKPA